MGGHIWRGPQLPRTADDLVKRALATADRVPGRPALIDARDGTITTYGALADGVRRVASSLSALGIGKGDVVATLTPNSSAWVTLALGVMAAGGVVTGINPMLKPEEIARQIKASGASVMAVVSSLLPMVERAGLDGLVREVVLLDGPLGDRRTLADLIRDGEADPVIARPAPEDIVLLPFSSGTAGFPKGVEVPARSLALSIETVRMSLDLSDGDVVMALTPFFHIAAVSGILAPALAFGLPVIIVSPLDIDAMLDAIERYRVAFTIVTPPVIRALAEHPAVERHDLSSLRAVCCTAAPLSAELQIAAARRVGATILQCYAMTESIGPIVIGPLSDPRPGSGGKVAPGVEIRIVDPTSGDDAPANAPGEVWFRSPLAMRGYHNDAGAMAEMTTADGWLRTGDLGRFDADGNLFVIDRLKELIKVNGAQVAPAELEAVIAAYPGVVDAAVIGCPSVASGEVPVACVVASAPIEARALMDWVAERVAPFKRLHAVEFVDAIPRQPTGKVLRRVLRERADIGAGVS
jgi:acyl-CoA synthetase (AMP-forming)/AMP-acid ligase II